MLSPADKMLSGDDAPEFFRKNYDAFSGVFAVFGIILGHGIQVIVKDYFNSKMNNDNYNDIGGKYYIYIYIQNIDNKI